MDGKRRSDFVLMFGILCLAMFTALGLGASLML